MGTVHTKPRRRMPCSANRPFAWSGWVLLACWLAGCVWGGDVVNGRPRDSGSRQGRADSGSSAISYDDVMTFYDDIASSDLDALEGSSDEASVDGNVLLAPDGARDAWADSGLDVAPPDHVDAAPPDHVDAAPPDHVDAAPADHPDAAPLPPCRDNQRIDSTCACTQGLMDCSGVCVDLRSNASSCGTCGHACRSDQACSSRSCVCAVSSKMDCGGACVDTSSDSNNCGTCGHVCGQHYHCSGSNCVVDCGLLLGGQVTQGWALRSCSGPYRLALQDDSNLVLYDDPQVGPVPWQSGTHAYGCDRMVMQGDGNLVLYYQGSTSACWATGTNGHPGAYLEVANDGHLRIRDSNGTTIWTSLTGSQTGGGG
jgi:hypothetical protein